MLSRVVCRYWFSLSANSASASSIAPSTDAFKGIRKYIEDYQPQRAEKGFGQTVEFEKDIKPALEQFKQLGFTRNELGKIFRSKISALTINNGTNNHLQQDIVQLTAFLKKQYSLDNNAIHRIVQNNHSLLSLTPEQINERFELLKQILSSNNAQTLEVLIRYPNIFMANMAKKFETTDRTLTVWAGITKDQVIQLFTKHPYIVDFNQEYLHDNVKYLVNKGFSSEQFFQLVLANPNVLLEKPAYLQQSFYLPKLLNLSQKETVNTFLKYPELISICPVSILPTKVKMLKGFKVIQNNLKDIWINHTEVFISSIGSLDLKSRYLQQRAFVFGKPKNLAAYFATSYSSVIRPRCEAAIKLKKTINLDEDLQISDEEFVAKTGISKEDLEKTKSEFAEHKETDQKKRFYHAVTQDL